MNRRAFLGTLATVLAGATLDPERLLWVPGQKTIFLPPTGNVFVTPQWVLEEGVRIMMKQLAFLDNVNRNYDSHFRTDDARVDLHVGATIPIRRH